MTRLVAALIVLILLLPMRSWAAFGVLDVDVAGDLSCFPTSTCGAVSRTLSAGTNRVLVVGIEYGYSGGNIPSVASVTWNTTETMTQQVSATDSICPSCQRAYFYSLVNPTSGTHDISVVTSAAFDALATPARIFSMTFVDAHQTTPVSNTAAVNDAACNSATTSIAVTSATGQYTLANASGGAALSAPTQTQIDLDNDGSNNNTAASEAAGAASVTHAWTMASADCRVLTAISVQPAAAGDETSGFRRRMVQ